MAADMKETIAEAARRLIFEKNKRKLTVKDIVMECQITRQAFYYHFEDIPALFCWVLERDMAQMLRETCNAEDEESALKHCFLVAINMLPYVKKSMNTNYGDEVERLLTKYIYRFFEQIIKEQNLYQSYDCDERKLIVRYHCQAIIGILKGWTEEDTRDLDQIVHRVYQLMSGAINPSS